MAIRRAITLIVAGVTLGCQPDTTRPSFGPVPEAARVEIRLPVRDATLRLAETLKADTIPTRLVHLRDGWFDTGWFEARSGATTHRRPVGPDVVRVRAWSDPGRPGYSLLTVETVYQAVADPALPARDLEQAVARDHPAAVRVLAALKSMADRYGTPPAESNAPAAGQRGAPDEEQPSPGDVEAPPDQTTE